MRAVIQRVKWAKVEVEEQIVGEVEEGLMVLLGITNEDDLSDIQWLTRKILKMRIFNDEMGKMNQSLEDVGGDILVVSQFTLYAATQKGNRPSYTRSAPPNLSIPLYEQFVKMLQESFNGKVETGEFGAMMKVSLLNDGPVTIIIDSKIQDL